MSSRLGYLARLFRGTDASSVISYNEPRKEILGELTNAIWYIYGADVPGDVIELGTMSGFTARHIAAAMKHLEKSFPISRRLVLADSFEGLPDSMAEADKASPHVAKGVWTAGSCKVLSRVQLEELCQCEFDPSRIDILEGWFSNTVPTLSADRRFAMLHVDCDLYQSTMDALVPLFADGMVSEGAIFLFDDWNCNRASPSHGERRAWAELTSRYEIASSPCCNYSWHGHKLIVHSYKGMPQSG
jgi:O-methyltransferase